jgi:erythrocyte band 7 integral membrane protein
MDSPRFGDNGKSSSSQEAQKGFQPRSGQNGIIKVQPPRREDLQPSYAQTLQGETEAETHGWYGSMSK